MPLDEDISIPNLEISVDELDPKNIFTPGYGSSLGVLTKKAVLLSIQKTLADERLSISVSSLLDINSLDNSRSIPGVIFSFETTYTIKDNLDLNVGYTNIKGDKNHPQGDNYRINIMEDFSHVRTSLRYNF